MIDRKINPTNPSHIKSGDILSFTMFVKAENHVTGDKLPVKGLGPSGVSFEVIGKDLISMGASADQYSETKKVTKTAAAEILISSYNRPFTVTFTKQDGTTRVLRGRLISAEPLLGRSKVVDLDIESGSAERLVDHRTIETLIVDGIRYEVKS